MTTLTVFTCVYNGEGTLSALHSSLLAQTSFDFKWLIIDDGSTDGTPELAKRLASAGSPFPVAYVRKENGGLHTGYNKAIELLDTELAVCIDADDKMPPRAVETIVSFWRENGSDAYAGIVAPDCTPEGNLVGGPLPDIPALQIKYLMTKYKKTNGDRKLVVRSDLYRAVAPQKTIAGEKNYNPHCMHLKISENYPFLVLQEPLCIVEYRSEGMSRNIFRQYLNSPNSFAEIRRLYMSLSDMPYSFILRQSVHYVSSCVLAKRYRDILGKTPRRGAAILTFFPGVLLSFYIRYHVHRGKR